MTSAESFPKPEQCATCPTLQKCERYIAIAEEHIEETTLSYQHGLQETVVDTLIKASDDDPLLYDDMPLDRDELITQFIQSQGDYLERLERSIGATRIHMELLKLGCKGLIRLRGTRGNIEYTVETCGSPQKEDAGRYEEESVRVRRKFVE